MKLQTFQCLFYSKTSLFQSIPFINRPHYQLFVVLFWIVVYINTICIVCTYTCMISILFLKPCSNLFKQLLLTCTCYSETLTTRHHFKLLIHFDFRSVLLSAFGQPQSANMVEPRKRKGEKEAQHNGELEKLPTKKIIKVFFHVYSTNLIKKHLLNIFLYMYMHTYICTC